MGKWRQKTIENRVAFIHKGFLRLKAFQILVGNGFHPIKTSQSRPAFICKGFLRTNCRRKPFSPQENPEIQVSIPIQFVQPFSIDISHKIASRGGPYTFLHTTNNHKLVSLICLHRKSL